MEPATLPPRLDRLPIFPLPAVQLFPHTLLPLHVFEQRYRDLTRDVLAGGRLMAVPTLAPVRVDEVVQAHARALALVARGMGLRIAVTAEADLPAALTILDRVEVAIDNVLFNALKYGARDSVVVVSVASRADAGPEDGRGRQRTESRFMFDHVHTFVAAPGERFLEVSVHNSGRPIPDHVRRRLFSPYVRGDEARGAHTSTGLGLSIVAECVRSLGGRVWLAGSDDTGTRFCFTVPLRSTRDA